MALGSLTEVVTGSSVTVIGATVPGAPKTVNVTFTISFTPGAKVSGGSAKASKLIANPSLPAPAPPVFRINVGVPVTPDPRALDT